MRVTINGRFLTQRPTGVQRYAAAVVREFDRALADGRLGAGFGCEVLTPDRPHTAPLTLDRIPVRRVGRFGGHLWEQLDLPRHCGGHVLYCPGNTAPAWSLLGRQRTVVVVHDLSFRSFPQAYSRAFRLLYGVLSPLVLRLGDALITDSHTEAAHILRHAPYAADRLRAIHCGVDAATDDADVDAAADAVADLPRRFALYVGSLNRRKNIAGFLAAVAHANRSGPLPAVVVGASGREFAGAHAPAHEAVRFLGQVDDRTLRMLYRRAACLVFPSWHEGFGLPPLEAMAHGCPVVVSRASCMPEVCGDAALYCDPADPHDIAARMRRLHDHPEIGAELAERGRRWVKRYTWERCAARTAEVLQAA